MSDIPKYQPSQTLGLQDLVILKSFIEKGYRTSLFTKQEEVHVKQVYDKITEILEGAVRFAKQHNLERK